MRLPHWRRYARALTGAQDRGDRYIRVCLEVLLKDPHRISSEGDVRLQLYSLFHEIWAPLAESEGVTSLVDLASDDHRSVKAKLETLAPAERQMLLLTSLEGFSIPHAAEILKLAAPEASEFLERAWYRVNRQLATTVLVSLTFLPFGMTAFTW